MAQFRAKARAIDLLGKGQIADLPTAITELWKNGYDAYGDNMEAHLYFPGYKDTNIPLFVLADDGIGMSEQDILEKWIVLGTDSKTRKKIPDKPGTDTLGKKPRIPTGEKGIGRLSVAYLGSQMLMLTKKINQPLQALFFDWRILDNLNLFLDDIDVPIIEIADIDNFKDSYNQLISQYRKNIPYSDNLSTNEQWQEHEELADDINTDLDNFSLSSYFDKDILNSFLNKDSHGTKFIIFNPIDQLLILRNHDKPEEENEETVEYIRSGLSGLGNVFKEEKPIFKTKFLIYNSEIPIDFILQRDFFDQSDFNNCDHLIEGIFNEVGEFEGRLEVYNEKIPTHFFKPNLPVSKTSFGVFSIKLGYVVGSGEPTTLNEQQFSTMNDKLKRVGGLYLYRDGFRVLPYGRKEFDFLAFEERRSKGAGYYFFSHRRMFGYIDISRINNPQLLDKAGREGLINNKAKREFVNLLISFFIDLARKYYGLKAESDLKIKQQEEIEEERKEKEREKEERKEFTSKLKEYPKQLKEIENELNKLSSELNQKIDHIVFTYEEIETILRKIDDCKIKLDNLKIEKPKRFKLSDNQREQLSEYGSMYIEFKDTSVSKVNKSLENAQVKLKEKELINEFWGKVKQYENSIISIIQDNTKKLDETLKKIKIGFNAEKELKVKNFKEKYSTLLPTKPNKKEIIESLSKIETLYHEFNLEITNKFKPFVNHISKLSLDINEDSLIGYYKLEFEKFKKRWEETQELAQLGIAVEIIDHQFNALYSQLANIISLTKNSIKKDKDSLHIYDLLKTSFEHLENNYKLLTPLYRTTGRVRKDIYGKEIIEYVNAFYSKELSEKNIELNSTEAFNKASYFTFESILKPVFINIVNNAIYWLRSVEKKKILFDYIDDRMIILNSGEPIHQVYIDGGDIFNLFFSRKPNGRGIGLYLAKTTLNGVGLEIVATNNPKYNKLNGACFMIFELEK